jgi:dethiobiotin synthetase
LQKPIFISGIGTGVGKTLVAAIVTEALQANYWKPVQAGFEEGTDSEWIKDNISNDHSIIHPELYKLKTPASPHIAARMENTVIEIPAICDRFNEMNQPGNTRPWVIEGAGGLLVPLNEKSFVIDLIKALKARVIIVSRHYLGSINHSLLTAATCRQQGLDVWGWIFNDQYMNYEDEIGFSKDVSRNFVSEQAAGLRSILRKHHD